MHLNTDYFPRNHRTNNDNSDGQYLRMAKIVRVDYESMKVDLVFLDVAGGLPKVSLTAPYAGYRSFLGAMPTVGDWVIIGFGKTGGFKDPFIIQFIPRGYKSGLNNDVIKTTKALDPKSHPELRFKMQKLYDGEIYGLSKYGSEFYLDKNVTISNSKLNEIFIRSADQSINLTALNNNIFSCGVRISSGLIHRIALIQDPELFDGSFSQFPVWYSEEGIPYYTPNFSGPINAQFPYGKKTIDDFNSAFIEHRIEVKEMETPRIPVNDANSGVDIDSLYSAKPGMGSNKPLVVQILGTLVGNDPVGDKKRYGTILKPKIFQNPNSSTAKPSEESCIVENGINETTTVAAAYALKFPNSGTAFYVNKQGKVFKNIAASTAIDSMGAGESAEINLQGHAKIAIGANSKNFRSITLDTKGGVLTNFGNDQPTMKSWDATFRNCVSWNILGKDKNNLSYLMMSAGDVKTVISGNRYTEIKGDDIRLVHGVLEDRVFGRKVDNFVNDKQTNYGGSYIETILGSYGQTIAQGRSVTIAAPDITSGKTVADSTEILIGDSELKMTLGNRKEQILAGNHTTQILAGNKSVNIVAGNYQISITAGEINIKNLVGSILIPKIGDVEITGKMGVVIKSAVSVKVTAPQVQLGALPVKGGVVNSGPAGHKCYITGGPHLGSIGVTCDSA